METQKEYYIYAYLREDKTPYYIGKGKGDRAFIKNRKGTKPPKDKSRIIFLKQKLTEEEAFKHEIYMIAVLGRKDIGTGILRNKTDGGEGPSGAIISKETKRKISEANKGENHPLYGKSPSEETRKKISEANKGENHPLYGKSHSEETRRKQSEAKKGKIVSEETRKKLSEAKKGKFSGENNPNYGKSPSEETRKKQSEKMKGRYAEKNHPMYGRSHSEETRRKQSEAKKGRKWWNDDKGNTKFSKESPGPNWVPGRGTTVTLSQLPQTP